MTLDEAIEKVRRGECLYQLFCETIWFVPESTVASALVAVGELNRSVWKSVNDHLDRGVLFASRKNLGPINRYEVIRIFDLSSYIANEHSANGYRCCVEVIFKPL